MAYVTGGIKKVDQNQLEIVKCLEANGCTVLNLSALGQSVPDLLVARHGMQHLVEIKSTKGKLTEKQEVWLSKWNCPVYVLRSVEETLQWLGNIKDLR